MGWVGFNCSIPHKVAVIEHLDGLGASAEVIGAVNCVVARDGRWIGENTDGQGFLEALKTVVDPAGRSLVIFGAGGAARAIAVEAALAGAASITVVNRGRERGEELAALLAGHTRRRGSCRGRATTPCPRARTSSSTPPRSASSPTSTRACRSTSTSLRPGMVVADVIGNPPRTRLIRDAEARGCTVLDGLGMLVNQGVIGIRHWTGIDPDPAVMRRALEDALGLT